MNNMIFIYYNSLLGCKFRNSFTTFKFIRASLFMESNSRALVHNICRVTQNERYTSKEHVHFCGSSSFFLQNDKYSFLKSYKSNMFTVRNFSFQSVAHMQANIFSYLSESAPVHQAQFFFEYVHNNSGLPWWSSIILVTIISRAIVAFPFALYQNYILAKVQNLQHEMFGISKELHKEVAFAIKKFGWSEKQAQWQYKYSLKKQWDKLIVRDNCHPFKASLPIWFQMPVWICLSISLRNMAYMLPYQDAGAEKIFQQMTEGGCLWFPNLIEADHTFILPAMLGIINLAIIELQCITRFKKSTKFHKYLINFFRIVSVSMIPVAANVPTCMSLYWVSSSICGLAQNLLVISPRLRKIVHIPDIKTDKNFENGMVEQSNSSKLPQVSVLPLNLVQQAAFQKHPYRHIAMEIQTRVSQVSVKIGIRKNV